MLAKCLPIHLCTKNITTQQAKRMVSCLNEHWAFLNAQCGDSQAIKRQGPDLAACHRWAPMTKSNPSALPADFGEHNVWRLRSTLVVPIAARTSPLAVYFDGQTPLSGTASTDIARDRVDTAVANNALAVPRPSGLAVQT